MSTGRIFSACYLLIPADGPVIYFDNEPGRKTGGQLETIDEVRDDILPLSYMFTGHRQEEWTRSGPAKWMT